MKDSILIPIIRKVVPSIIAEDIMNVQPMNSDIFDSSKFIKHEYYEGEYDFGDIIHNFIKGYMAYNGNKFINIDEFRKEYPEFEKTNVDGWVKMVKNSCHIP